MNWLFGYRCSQAEKRHIKANKCGDERQPGVTSRAHRSVPFLYRQLRVFTFFTMGTEAPRSPEHSQDVFTVTFWRDVYVFQGF